MVDLSGLIGKTFQNSWDGEPVTVLGGYLHDGNLTLILSKAGGPLYEGSIDCLKP